MVPRSFRLRRLAVAGAIGVVSIAPLSASGGESVVLSLVDRASGLAVSRADVWIEPSRTRIAVRSDGTFVIPRADLPSAGCRIRIAAEGFDARSVECPGTSDGAIDVALSRRLLRTQESLTVSAQRSEAAPFDLPVSTAVIGADELERTLPRTTPEALMQTPGVWVQKTNHGGGAPFVRGLVGNQVLILVDGVRLNNATVRYGPNQYLATVDPGQIERIEVLRGGGGSVRHGSDALGGVINIVTRRPQFAAGGTSLEARASGRVVNEGMERSGRVDVSAASPRLALAAGVANRDYGDLRAGGSLGVEAPSGYRETNGDAVLVAQLAPRLRATASYQHVHQFDVPRFDQVAQRGFARYSFDPQVRQLGAAELDWRGRGGWLQAATVRGSWHRSRERRERQTRGSAIAISEEDRVTTTGVTLQAQSATWRAWSLRYGADVYADDVRSRRDDLNTTTGATIARRGLYPDRASAIATGAFATAALDAGRTSVDLGIRATRMRLDARDATFGELTPVSRAVVGHGAAAFALTPGLRVYGSVSQGFRAPNLDDVSTLGLFDSGIEVPSPGLQPERSLALEAGAKWRSAAGFAAASVWRSGLSHLIDRVRSRIGGADVLDGQRVYQRQNVGDATVHGFEVEGEHRLRGGLSGFAWAAYARGQQTTVDQPMRRIPPLNGAAGLRWTGRRLAADVQARVAAAQRRLAQGDRDDHRIAPGGTPGWTTVGGGAAFQLTPVVRLVGGVENLFDRAYRVHGSGIDGYGRHVWLGLHVTTAGRRQHAIRPTTAPAR